MKFYKGFPTLEAHRELVKPGDLIAWSHFLTQFSHWNGTFVGVAHGASWSLMSGGIPVIWLQHQLWLPALSAFVSPTDKALYQIQAVRSAPPHLKLLDRT